MENLLLMLICANLLATCVLAVVVAFDRRKGA